MICATEEFLAASSTEDSKVCEFWRCLLNLILYNAARMRTPVGRRRILCIALHVLLALRATVLASSFIVVDANTGFILAARDEKNKAPVASLTKIATAAVVIDWLELSKNDVSQIATVSPQAASVGGVNPVGLRPGDGLSIRDLLYCALLQSDNIAASTLAHHVGSVLMRTGAPGSNPINAFVFQMNQLAAKLRMRRTRFVNPTGLESGNQVGFSSAADMARLTQYAIKNSAFRFYVSQKERKIQIYRTDGTSSYLLRNTNQLLGSMGVDGVKTGRTARAGDCLILSAARDPESRKEGERFIITPRRLIVVLLKSQDRFSEGAALLRRGWSSYDAWAAQGRPVDPKLTL